jgi:hypothetical protein
VYNPCENRNIQLRYFKTASPVFLHKIVNQTIYYLWEIEHLDYHKNKVIKMSNKLTNLKIRKGQVFAFMAILLMAGLLFASLIPVSGLEGKIMGDETETDELDETSEVENGDKEEDEDTDDDSVDDETEERNKRETETEIEDYSVQVKSELKNGENKDEIKIKFTADDNPKFKLEYSSEAGDLEYELEFTIKFKSITEYNDLDSNGVYNKSVDETVQVYRFEDIDFLPIQYSTIENTTIKVFNSTTVDGVFSLFFYVSGEFSLINRSLVAPTEMKIDIGIHDFPYMNATSRLALYTKLESESEYEYDDETDDETEGFSSEEVEVEVSTGEFTGFFSWSEIVNVDGVNQSVLTSPIGKDDIDDNEQKLYLNYPHGIHIVHDPKLGVTGLLSMVPPSTGVDGFSAMITLFAFISVGVFTIYRRKRR